MEIKNVINKGEVINDEYLSRITGGTGAGMQDNLNRAERCSCHETGNNNNDMKDCYCNGDKKDDNESALRPGGGGFTDDKVKS